MSELSYDLSSTDSTDGTNSTTTATETYNDAQTISNMMKIYGSLFLAIIVVFSYVRQKFPRVYNVRSWLQDIKTPLANNQFGFLSWIYKVYLVSDSEMLDECGMDALCYARVIEFGVRLSVMGMLVGAVLIPVYVTSEESVETSGIDDPIVRMSTSNVPTGSSRFIATVVCAYVIFGYAMYNILQEFEWFYRNRYTFLQKPIPRNYAVYVQNIPEEYQTRRKLLEYFERFARMGNQYHQYHDDDGGSGGNGGVHEAVISLKNPNLKKKVAERDGIITNLEHTINIEDVTGRIPKKKDGTRTVQHLSNELRSLNTEISNSIEQIEHQQQQRDQGRYQQSQQQQQQQVVVNSSTMLLPPIEEDNHNGGIYDNNDTNDHRLEETTTPDFPIYSEHGEQFSSTTTPLNDITTTETYKNEETTGLAGSAKSLTASVVGNIHGSLHGTIQSAVSLFSSEDGQPLTAGFVTFRSLSSVYAALQMVQYPQPFAFEVREAPGVDDIFWQNVGKTHKQLQLGLLLSVSLTTALCLFWTIPMSFISTLSTIEGLRAEVPWIDDLLTKLPWLEPLLAQLAPLLIVVAQEVLKLILELMSGLEGPVSGAVVQASLFSKLAVFMIIQTFFVSALSGSIFSQLSLMIQNPTMIVDLLANTLPTRSTFFIQILFVDTSVSLGVELLRVVPLAIASVRAFLGPRLTQEEKETTWMGLRPLADPVEFEHANLLAGSVLYFVVYFVYAVLAPITSFFMFACFLLIGAGYRNQLIYIYPTEPDSGGKLWIKFMRLVPVFMFIAQITLIGFLALKRTPIASALMFPLLIITIIFTIYISQEHFSMCDNLPANVCVEKDDRNNFTAPMDMSFLDGQYVQPELEDKLKYPENLSLERQRELEIPVLLPDNTDTKSEATTFRKSSLFGEDSDESVLNGTDV